MSEVENFPRDLIMQASAFVSSNETHPPFKEVVQVYSFSGHPVDTIFHESEHDEYDFLNESPVVIHLIHDFAEEIFWRYPLHIALQKIAALKKIGGGE